MVGTWGLEPPDLYRINFEVRNLKPFFHLAFPHFATSEKSSKHRGFDGEVMSSSSAKLVRDSAAYFIFVLLNSFPDVESITITWLPQTNPILELSIQE
jgi:hypothetical protein